MPLWEIDFSDIDSDTEVPADIDDDDQLPEGYNQEFEKVDNFIADNLQRAKETKDVAMIGFIVEQGIERYKRLGLKKHVLDQQIWMTTQLGKGMLKNFQKEAKGAELKTQIAFMVEMIADQKKKELELRNRVAALRAERDFKKARLEAVIRGNQGLLNEISHINKRHALIQERLRLDTIEYEQEKALRDDLRETFVGYSEDLDRQLKNAPWLVEKQKEAARKKELEDAIKGLEADIAKIDLLEERNRIAEESERDLPFKQFCVQLAELYVKREKLFKQLADEKAKAKKLEDERRARRALEDTMGSQMDCTQAILDGDLDDEETLLRMAKHYKIDTQNLNVPMTQMSQMTQQSQPRSQAQQISRKRAPSPAESSASSEANDEDISEGGEERAAAGASQPPTKRVTIVEPVHNPDESVDEGVMQMNVPKEESLNESVMEEEEERTGEESQPEQMETDEREEEEDEEQHREEEVEQQEQEDGPGSQESQVTVASQESYAPGEVVEQEEEVEENDGFLRPSLIPTKIAPAAVEENEDMVENEEAETSFNPDLMLNISTSSNDPGADFFDMMNNQATSKRAAADASGSSPTAAGDGDFMSMFGGGGESAAADGDAASFSFNFGAGDGNETNGGGGGEFNFFGF